MYFFTESRKRNNRLGFTLMELMFVISIIGLLATAILGNLRGARVKAHNTVMLAELVELRKAMQLYVSDENERFWLNNFYNFAWNGDIGGSASLDLTLQPIVDGGYIPEIPHYHNWPVNSDTYYIGVETGLNTATFRSGSSCNLNANSVEEMDEIVVALVSYDPEVRLPGIEPGVRSCSHNIPLGIESCFTSGDVIGAGYGTIWCVPLVR